MCYSFGPLDAEITDIQRQFEAELDNLIMIAGLYKLDTLIVIAGLQCDAIRWEQFFRR